MLLSCNEQHTWLLYTCILDQLHATGQSWICAQVTLLLIVGNKSLWAVKSHMTGNSDVMVQSHAVHPSTIASIEPGLWICANLYKSDYWFMLTSNRNHFSFMNLPLIFLLDWEKIVLRSDIIEIITVWQSCWDTHQDSPVVSSLMAKTRSLSIFYLLQFVTFLSEDASSQLIRCIYSNINQADECSCCTIKKHQNPKKCARKLK